MVLRMKLQGDESDLWGDPGDHGLHRLVLGDIHILKCSRQKNHTICNGESQISSQKLQNFLMYSLQLVSAIFLSFFL